MNSSFKKLFLLALMGILESPTEVLSHGRLMEPPNRSSLWRLPEYDQFDPPRNYNDNELFCGGFEAQHEHNGGKCGECGDLWSQSKPRDNENGGIYGNGVITKTYTAGQTFNIIVELTFGHLGYFEFRICNLDNATDQPENENCFEHLLELENGSGSQFPIPSAGAAWYKIIAKLPQGLTCSHCVLQWHYEAGNSWGECEDGSMEIGCGPQETFRGCSDIAINP